MDIYHIRFVTQKDPHLLEDLENALVWILPQELEGRYSIDLGAKPDDPCSVTLYAPQPEPLRELGRQLITLFPTLHPIEEHPTRSDEHEWLARWKASLKPFLLTDRIMIDPREEDLAIDFLKITPAMAFGTGDHATTRLSAQMLQKTVRPGSFLLDVGCGTAILAMTGILLGAARATAVDMDPIAVESARSCVQRNGMDNRIQVLGSDLLEGVEGSYDIVVANITADVLKRLLADASGWNRVMKPGGRVVLSGVVEGQKDGFLSWAKNHGFAIVEEAVESPWLCWIMERG